MRRAWLPLISISSPMVSGRSVSRVKYLMVCGLPSSNSVKSSLDRLPTSPPALFLTEHKMLTTSTSTLMEGVVSSESGGFFDWGCAGARITSNEAARSRRAYAVGECIASLEGRVPSRLCYRISVGVGGSGRVVTLPGLRQKTRLAEEDFDPPVRAVFSIVGRNESQGVLAAHLCLNLVEDLLERMLLIDAEEPAARLVGHLLERRPAWPIVPVDILMALGIHIVDAVDNGIGFLRRVDCVADP